jgi:hypothetical protein
MKLSAILEPLIAAGIPGEVILATVRAYEEQAGATSEEGKEKARQRWRRWKNKQNANVGKRLPTDTNVSNALTHGEGSSSNQEISEKEGEERNLACSSVERNADSRRLPSRYRGGCFRGPFPARGRTPSADVLRLLAIEARQGRAQGLDWPATWRIWFRAGSMTDLTQHRLRRLDRRAMPARPPVWSFHEGKRSMLPALKSDTTTRATEAQVLQALASLAGLPSRQADDAELDRKMYHVALEGVSRYALNEAVKAIIRGALGHTFFPSPVEMRFSARRRSSLISGRQSGSGSESGRRQRTRNLSASLLHARRKL